ncbi:mitotic checkpoint regulator, MAD2B-interacting-domain-containing protein [Xylariaceae sp. FL0804]|nr:mitotic checkpoint regulator, MAD2B-interacting-domain-containing protein [Xylariaceae sp. FL0804]
MGLVDYSDSESESESTPKPAPQAAAPPTQTSTGKKPSQRLVDRSNPGRIRVNLPQSSAGEATDKPATGAEAEEPPAKRARVAARGGGAFSGFNSFLPPPKNLAKAAGGANNNSVVANSGGAPRLVGASLRTSAAPGFSRETHDDDEQGERNGGAHGSDNTNGGAHPPVSRQQQQQQPQPTIPKGQKAADEVKLVGKPLMFKPLSVSRKPGKKAAAATVKPAASAAPPKPVAATTTSLPAPEEPAAAGDGPPPPKKQKKMSLFAIEADEPPDGPDPLASSSSGVYEPLLHHTRDAGSEFTSAVDDFAAYDAQHGTTAFFASGASPAAAAAAPASATPHPSSSSSSSAGVTYTSLDDVAASMNLSATARRELFGRRGDAAATPMVASFDTSAEYASNEALRAAGALDAQAHNPVRAVAPGKHSLQQLVNQVRSQRGALEDSFAQGKSAQRDAGSRYGWR